MQQEIASPSLIICILFVQYLKVDIPVLPPASEVPDGWALLIGI